MVVFPPRQHDFGVEQAPGFRDGKPGLAEEARSTVRDERIGHVLQIASFLHDNVLQLRGVVGIHHMNLGRRLRGDMGLRVFADLDLQRHPVALQHATRCRDDEYAGHLRHGLVPVQRALDKERHTPIHKRHHAAIAPIGELKPQVPVFADRAAGHLRRFILIGAQFRSFEPDPRKGRLGELDAGAAAELTHGQPPRPFFRRA